MTPHYHNHSQIQLQRHIILPIQTSLFYTQQSTILQADHTVQT